ncbi:MAG: phosphatase PAP2 family protein, partial [Candidatus Nanohaloarchaea archaeon]
MLEQIQRGDRAVLRQVSALELPFLEGAMSSVTGLGSVYLALVFLLATWAAGMTTFVTRAGIGLAGVWGVAYAMKYIVRRKRPSESHRSAVGYSFPSGHSATAFYLAVVFSTLIQPAVLLYLVAALVAVSRIYFRLHYPLDALA